MSNQKQKFFIYACSISIIVLWVFLLLQYRYDQKQAISAAEANVLNLSKAFEENLLGTIRHLDNFLITLRQDYPGRQDQIPTLISSYNRHSSKELIIQLSITDVRGIMVYNTKAMPDKPLDLSDREHVRVHLSGGDDQLFISKPVMGRVSKKWSIQFTRKILDRNGTFVGVAVLSVDPDYFTSFFKSIDVGSKGAITLLGMDGVIRARSNGTDSIGVSIPPTDIQIDPKRPQSGIFHAASHVDHVHRIGSYRRLKNYPLVVLVASAEEEVLSAFYWHLAAIIMQGIFATIGIVLFFRLAQRLNHRQQSYTKELETHNRSMQQLTCDLGDTNVQLEQEIAERQMAQEALAVKQSQLEALNCSLQQRIDAAVTEIRQKDQVLISQSRQAAMGEMIGNIAHQWRQPLNALAMVLGNINAAHQYNELTTEYLDKTVIKGNLLLQKMSATITDFSNFFRPNKEVVSFSAREQINHAVTLVEAGLESQNISVQLDAPQDLLLTGFPNEYSQVLINLLANAKDAIKQSGAVEGCISIRLHEQAGNGCVTISDTGGGIPGDVIDKIFEPYFSTKEMGTGIGLYMSKMIIAGSMHGHIEAHNIDGGAEFIITTPIKENKL